MNPRVVVNGLTGERVVFGEYGRENGVDYLDIDEVTLEPGRDGPPAHAHLLGDEELEVTAGRLGARVDGADHELAAGERLTVPAGAVHEWWNAGEETVVIRGRLWRPGRFEEALTTIFALVNRGQVTAKGTPKLLDAAVWVAEYRDEYEASFLPRPMRLLLRTVLAPIARVLGHRIPVAYTPPRAAS